MTQFPSERAPVAQAEAARDARIASYAGLAVSLHVVESVLPSLIPGVKPGLANMVVIVVLFRHGWREAVWVSLLRVLVGSLLIGQFLAPAFWLSLAGAVGSLLALALGSLFPGRGFGPVGFSVLAALAHVSAQVAVAWALFFQHPGIFLLLPGLWLAALVFGVVNGLAAYWLMERLQGVKVGASGE